MQTNGKETYLSVTAAAVIVGVSRQTMHEWIRAGRVKTRTFAGRRVLYRSQVERLAESRRTKAAPASPVAA